MLIALRLAKAGYYGGDPERVMDANIDHVVTSWEYEIFISEYEEVAFEINKGS